jgi:NADH:ubiquinone oxidoreductase subunit 4 (subunit M)
MTVHSLCSLHYHFATLLPFLYCLVFTIPCVPFMLHCYLVALEFELALAIDAFICTSLDCLLCYLFFETVCIPLHFWFCIYVSMMHCICCRFFLNLSLRCTVTIHFICCTLEFYEMDMCVCCTM